HASVTRDHPATCPAEVADLPRLVPLGGGEQGEVVDGDHRRQPGGQGQLVVAAAEQVGAGRPPGPAGRPGPRPPGAGAGRGRPAPPPTRGRRTPPPRRRRGTPWRPAAWPRTPRPRSPGPGRRWPRSPPGSPGDSGG